jgi:[acyl-carrier-protein] S-malonyltransferase
MDGYAFMFPGQGSQAVGMGKDLAEKFPAAKKRFDDADRILGRGLSGICFQGPEDELKVTSTTQPALFTLEAAIVDVLAEKGIRPAVVMGHSLGEYSALYAAGVVGFKEGLALVARRGELMAQAGKSAPGAMAAVVGMEKEKIAVLLTSITGGTVVCANENTPEQTVISGDVSAVNTACEMLKAAGAKRAILLPVSGAFHSPLMAAAAAEFEKALTGVAFGNPSCPVICNVTAKGETNGQTIKNLLVKQLVSPVRWVDSVLYLKGLGITAALEVGPGAVLQGLVKKIDATMSIISCGKAENIFSLS